MDGSRAKNRETDLVGLDMGTEPGAEGLREGVHLGTVAGEDGAVDDESWGPESIEILALVLVDEVLFLGLSADVVGGARLLWDERVGLGMLLCAHGRRTGKGKEGDDGRKGGRG